MYCYFFNAIEKKKSKIKFTKYKNRIELELNKDDLNLRAKFDDAYPGKLIYNF